MDKIRKILIRQHKKYYWSKGDLHTDSGVVKEQDLEKDTNKVKAHSGKEFFVFDAGFNDKIEKIKRLPQAILEKDIAVIVNYSNIDKNSIVLEAGTGSGKLAAFLSRYCKNVISYEKVKDHINIAKKNLEFLDVNNVEVKEKDIYDGIEEKDLDVVILDLPEPFKVSKFAYKSLKNGGFLVVYVPSIIQIKDFVESALKEEFILVKVIELIEREWFVDKLKVRPKSDIIGHTGFICFVRKV